MECEGLVVDHGGLRLSAALRGFMESRFRHPFDGVRIHTGPMAQRIADALGANACTFGRDIFFAAGAFKPDTDAGRRLLAHELAHVVQQDAASSPAPVPLGIGAIGDRLEQEAERAAEAVMRGRVVPALSPDMSGLIRRDVQLGDALLSVATPEGLRALVGVTSGSRLRLADNVAHFTCSPLFVKGLVELMTTPRGSLAGCVVGFIQLQFIETNRFRYRGRTLDEGSVLIDRAAARPRQLCRDTATVGEGRFSIFQGAMPPRAWNPYWYANPAEPQGVDPSGDLLQPTRFLRPTDLARASGRLVVRTDVYDSPEDGCPLVVDNAATGHQNFLREAELEFHFCTILAALVPGSHFHIEPLKHVYWNVIWHVLFTPGPTLDAPWIFTPVGLHGMHVQGTPHSGMPNDHRFRDRLADTGLANCNAVAFQTSHRPVAHPPSRDWRWAAR